MANLQIIWFNCDKIFTYDFLYYDYWTLICEYRILKCVVHKKLLNNSIYYIWDWDISEFSKLCKSQKIISPDFTATRRYEQFVYTSKLYRKWALLVKTKGTWKSYLQYCARFLFNNTADFSFYQFSAKITWKLLVMRTF